MYNGIMLKNISKVMIGSAGVLAVAAVIVSGYGEQSSVHAETTTFQVNVKESLTVAVSTPSTWASGNVNEFLRNTVNVNVNTNNANGFTASMYSQNTTNLTNTAKSTETLPTLSSNYTCANAACATFPANYWGYSLNDASNTGTYSPMTSSTSSPITLISAAAGTSTGTKDVYFGAKADMTKAAGTYAGTVIISVVTGVVDSSTNPVTPTNPATPNTTNNTPTYNPGPTGGSSNGSTTYTYRSTSSGVATTTTQVSDGDNTSAYNGYTPPQGVTDKTIAEVTTDNSSLATGLATTAAVAATSGLLFFIIAKRRDEDDDEEDELS